MNVPWFSVIRGVGPQTPFEQSGSVADGPLFDGGQRDVAECVAGGPAGVAGFQGGGQQGLQRAGQLVGQRRRRQLVDGVDHGAANGVALVADAGRPLDRMLDRGRLTRATGGVEHRAVDLRAVVGIRPAYLGFEQGERLVVREETGGLSTPVIVVSDGAEGQHSAGLLEPQVVREDVKEPGGEDGPAQVDGLGDAGEDGCAAAGRQVLEKVGGVRPHQLTEGDQVVVGVAVEPAADGRSQGAMEDGRALGLEEEFEDERIDVDQPAEDGGDCCRQLTVGECADQQAGGPLRVLLEHAGDAEGGALPPLVSVRAGREGAQRVVVDGLRMLRAQTAPLAAAEAVGEVGKETADRLVVGGDEEGGSGLVTPAFAVLVDQAGGEQGTAGFADYLQELAAEGSGGVVVQDA
jgi:hypothetical protein